MQLIEINQVAVAQEFHISVTPLGEDEYLVRIERVAPGVPLAEEQVRWPVDEWLAQARQLMNDPLLGLLHGDAAFGEDIFYLPEWDKAASQSSLNLVALGQQLYNALFQGSLRDSWIMAQAVAQNQRQVLRLRLGLKGTRLPRLPWEVLHGGDRPLATGTDIAFSRYQLSTGLWSPRPTPAQPHQPLKILMVVSGPSDQETLELAREVSQLQEELKSRSPNEPPTIQLTILEQPGREQLTQALEQGHYQVFHYAGHSSLGDSGGDVYLVSSKTGLTETLNGEDLAGLLVNNGIQLAVFNSCRGTYTAVSDTQRSGQEQNLAQTLVKRGIPGVLAMAERIPDEVALSLTRLLYRNLNQGYPIDLSLSRARQGLVAAYGSNQLYWALPVLYLHPEFDGFLTQVDEATQSLADLFLLDPPESPAFQQEESLFTAPPRLTPTSFVKQDELDPAMNSDLAEYDDEELGGFLDGINPDDPDADDPSAFIRDLLNQLDAKPTRGAVEPVRNSNKPASASSEPVGLGMTANPTNLTPPPQGETSATIPEAHNNQALPPQPENPAISPKPVERRKPTRLKWWQLQSIPKLGIGLGAVGVVAIALLGLWFFQQKPRPRDLITESTPSIPGIPSNSSSQPVTVKTADTNTVTGNAIVLFNQGKVLDGQKAVEELLNWEALPQAKAALDAVPKSHLDDAAISFLRGRLAWQSVKAGSKDYDLTDARRYWERAHKAQPKSSAYLNALGFAYYAEGNFERANQAWFDALYIMEDPKALIGQARDKAKKEALNTYAGLALGLRQYAQKQTPAKRANLLKESLKLRKKVMTDDPVNFQPNALPKNWLWTAKTIQDWRSLLATSN